MRPLDHVILNLNSARTGLGLHHGVPKRSTPLPLRLAVLRTRNPSFTSHM